MDEDARTIWCGNLSNKCTEDILHELFLQAGPLEKVNIPKNADGTIKSFGFVTYKHEVSVPYALKLFEGTMLYNRVLSLKARQNSDSKNPPPSWKPNIPDPNSILQYGQLLNMNNHMFNLQQNLIPMIIPPGAGLYPSQLDSTFGPNLHHRHVERNHPYSREDNHQRGRNRNRDHFHHDHHDHHQKNHRDHKDHKNHKDHKEFKNQRPHRYHGRNKRHNR